MRPSDTARKSSYEARSPWRHQSRSEVTAPSTSELSTSNHSDGKDGSVVAFLKSSHQTVGAVAHLKARESQIT